jgi:DNA-binding NarL/FixJ family response regulator
MPSRPLIVPDPTIVSRLVARGRRGPLAELTEREREVLSLMAEGRSNEGICRELFLSPETVEGHIRQIFLKLGVGAEPERNRRVLAVLAFLRANG